MSDLIFMYIANANLLDLNALYKLEKACFEADAWPLMDLMAMLTFPNVVRLKALEDGKLVGFVGGDPRPHDGWGWVATIGVDPGYRRRGIGLALLHACEARLGVPNVRLTVRVSNLGAIALYHNDGYQIIDLWKNYYNDGGDAQVMEKKLR
ncbi:MAG: GNAT family N-acetyltransferase [Anaerolineales bacterium]|nr:GNAT family N-acetyltransferase [Anaerolineales bacterium]